MTKEQRARYKAHKHGFVIVMVNYVIGPFPKYDSAIAYRDKLCSKTRKWRVIPLTPL